MSNDELKNLAMALSDCGKTFIRIADAMAKNKDDLPTIDAKPTEKELTLEDVRAVLAEKARAGHTEEVRELLKKYGADRLSAVEPAKYQALLKDAEVLNSGKKHALLSASSSHRWIACPPSAMLCAKEKDVFSEYAKRGTDAHSLCEHKLKILLGMATCDPTETLDFFDQEMADSADAYAQFVMEQVAEGKETCKDILVLVEQKLDFSRWVPDGFGTGDCVIVADDTLRVIDFKYGVGVLVDVENNPQMMC